VQCLSDVYRRLNPFISRLYDIFWNHSRVCVGVDRVVHRYAGGFENTWKEVDPRRVRGGEGDEAQIVRSLCNCGCGDGVGVLAASRCVPMCVGIVICTLKG